MTQTSFMTASYAGDFERCRLLCESMDRHVAGFHHHWLLVSGGDVEQFRSLQGARRTVVDERDLLPDWLHPVGPNVLTRDRVLYLSPRTWPMRGWHVQQLRRIAFAAQASEDAIIGCDSDMIFVRPFDAGSVWREGRLRHFRDPQEIGTTPHYHEHRQWCRSAARLVGAPAPDFPAPNYIHNLVAWKSEIVAQMNAAIEQRSGRHWVAAIGRCRTFSECQIYGAFADGVMGGEGLWSTDRSLCLTYWGGPALDETTAVALLAELDDDQVAVGVQSFTEAPMPVLRRIAGV